MNISIGRSYFGMYSFVDTTKPRMGVRLFIAGLDAKAHFELLRQQRVDIEKEIGEELSWEKKPSKKESYVGLYDTPPEIVRIENNGLNSRASCLMCLSVWCFFREVLLRAEDFRPKAA